MDKVEPNNSVDKLRIKLANLYSNTKTSTKPLTSSYSNRSLHKRTNTELNLKPEILPKDISYLEDKKPKSRSASKVSALALNEILGFPSNCKKLPESLAELEEMAYLDPVPKSSKKNPDLENLHKQLKNNKEKYLKQVAAEGGFLYRTHSGLILPHLSGVYEQLRKSGDSSGIPRIELDLGKPSGRNEVKILIAWLENMMDTFVNGVNNVNIEEKTRRASLINTVCLKEVIRQVSNHCLERGALLHRIWNAQIDVYSIKDDKKDKEIRKLQNELVSSLSEKDKQWMIKQKKFENEIKEIGNVVKAKEKAIAELQTKINELKIQFVNDRRKIIKGMSSTELVKTQKNENVVNKMYLKSQIPVVMIGFYDPSGFFHKTKVLQEVNGERITEENIDQVVPFIDVFDKETLTEKQNMSVLTQTEKILNIEKTQDLFIDNKKPVVSNTLSSISKLIAKSKFVNIFDKTENKESTKNLNASICQIKKKSAKISRQKRLSKSLNSSFFNEKMQIKLKNEIKAEMEKNYIVDKIEIDKGEEKLEGESENNIEYLKLTEVTYKEPINPRKSLSITSNEPSNPRKSLSITSKEPPRNPRKMSNLGEFKGRNSAINKENPENISKNSKEHSNDRSALVPELLQEPQAHLKYKIIKTSIDTPSSSSSANSISSNSLSCSERPKKLKKKKPLKKAKKVLEKSIQLSHLSPSSSFISNRSESNPNFDHPKQNKSKSSNRKNLSSRLSVRKHSPNNELESVPITLYKKKSSKDFSKSAKTSMSIVKKIEKLVKQEEVLSQFKAVNSARELESMLTTFFKPEELLTTDNFCQTEEILPDPSSIVKLPEGSKRAIKKKVSSKRNTMVQVKSSKEFRTRQQSPIITQVESKIATTERSRSRKKNGLFEEFSLGGALKRFFISHPSQKLFAQIMGTLNADTGNLKMTLKNLLKIISSVYQEKLNLCKENTIYYKYELFMILYDWLMKRYGLKNVAEGHFLQVIKSTVVYKEKYSRVRLFSRFLGTEADSFSLEDWNFFINCLEIADYNSYGRILNVDEGTADIMCSLSTSQHVTNLMFLGKVPEKTLDGLNQKIINMKIVAGQSGSKRQSILKIQENVNLDDFLQLCTELFVDVKTKIKNYYWPGLDIEHLLPEEDYLVVMKNYNVEEELANKLLEKFGVVQKSSEEKLQKSIKVRSLASLFFENSLFNPKFIF